MLVLQRKPGERIVMGQITVGVSKVVGNRVSIAIDAPQDVRVLREEIAPVLSKHKSLEDELATQPLTRSRGDVPAEIAIKLVTALRMLAEGMQEPDGLFPEKYVKIIASKSHIEDANKAVAEYHDWLSGKGGDQ